MREGPLRRLFANLPDRLQIWNSHGDKLTRLPKGFKAVAASDNSEFAAIEDPARQFLRAAISPGGGAHAARARNHRQFRPWHLRLRQAMDDAPFRRAGGRGNPGPNRRGTGHPGTERRSGFERGGGPAAQGGGEPTDLHLCQQWFAAGGRGGSRAGSFRTAFQNQTAIPERLAPVSRPAQRRDRSGAQTQDHRQDLHRSFRGGGPARGPRQVPGAGHALSRCHRIGPHRGQPGGLDQEPPQRGRPAQEPEIQIDRAAQAPVQG